MSSCVEVVVLDFRRVVIATAADEFRFWSLDFGFELISRVNFLKGGFPSKAFFAPTGPSPSQRADSGVGLRTAPQRAQLALL